MVSKGEFKAHLLRLKEEAERSYQRRVVAYFGEREEPLAWTVEFLKERSQGCLILTADGEISGIRLEKGFHLFSHKETEKLLGRTYPNLIMDLTENLVPNDLGRAVGLIQGGGLVVLLFPRKQEFFTQLNTFQKNTLPPPFTEKDVRHYFSRWLYRTLLEGDGIFLVDGGNVIKEGILESGKWKREEVEVDERDPLSPLKRMAVTVDQKNGIDELLKFSIASRKKCVFLLIADRGRGKSATLGLSAAGYVFERGEGRIALTSPEKRMAEESIKFFKEGLTALNVGFQENPGGLIHGVDGKWSFRYVSPGEALAGRWDLLMVDEAAAIPYRILLKLAGRSPAPVFSTTIHGYEGSGRSFTVKFIQRLAEEGYDIKRFWMEEPIRHAPRDPVEMWLFRALMLSAEPCEIPQRLDRKKLRFSMEAAGEVLERDEEFFRRYFGIFILAHYKNTPNDLAILLDGANQRMATLAYKNVPLVAIQVADEGGLSPNTIEKIYSGWIPPGNLIPDCFIKYYRDEEYGMLKGLRVVRIATHPYLQGRGLGTEALRKLEERAKTMGYDYLGTSFGASAELINFWLKNGYTAVHISPSPNPVSGEHSVIMIKPLGELLKKRMDDLKSSFIRRTIEGLPDALKDVEPEVVRRLFDPPPTDFHLHLDSVDLKRAVAYAWGTMTYVVSRDVVLPFAKAYFSTNKRPVLERKEEILLIARVLQCRPWEECARMIRKGPVYTMIKLKDILKVLIRYYSRGEELEREIQRHLKRG